MTSKTIVPSKALKKLRNPSRSDKKKLKTLDNLLSHKGAIPKERILHHLLLEFKLSECLRHRLVWEISQIPSKDSVRALRLVVHDKTAPHDLRVKALNSLVLFEDELLHVDLSSLLTDPVESTKMRAESAHQIGGMQIHQLKPLIIHILKKNEVDPHILFWCLYASSGFKRSKKLVKAVQKYCDDMREVDTGMKNIAKGPATLASEAQWAMDYLNGTYREPDWVIESKSPENNS